MDGGGAVWAVDEVLWLSLATLRLGGGLIVRAAPVLSAALVVEPEALGSGSTR